MSPRERRALGLMLALLPLALAIQPLWRWLAPGGAVNATFAAGSKDPWGNPFVFPVLQRLSGGVVQSMPEAYSSGPDGVDDSVLALRLWARAPGPAGSVPSLGGDDVWVEPQSLHWTVAYRWGWATPLVLAGAVGLALALSQLRAPRGALRVELGRTLILATPLWLFALLPPLLYAEALGAFPLRDLPLLVHPRVALGATTLVAALVLCGAVRLRRSPADAPKS